MPSFCEFNLNKINAVYFSGETIEGTIVLNTTSPKVVADVSIIFKGEGKVKWEKRSGKHTKTYKAKELYVDNSSCVYGEGTLPPGSHSYTFFITLPEASPTSLEGRYGHIRYELSLKLNRPNWFDKSFSKPITVIKIMDLNLTPSYRLPIENEDIATSCCWSFSSDRVLYTLRVPFGGYTSGQALKYLLHIDNKTMSDTNGYSIEFYQNVSFTAHKPSRKTRSKKLTLYKERFYNPCLRLTSRQFEGQFLIPATPPSTGTDGIIAVEYFLKVIMHLNSCDVDSELTIPIFIGTVPLRDMLPSSVAENTNLLQVTQPTAPLNDEIGNNLPPTYKDLGPPTFEEAMRSNSPFIDTDIDEENRNTRFRPLYPMYSQTDE